MKFTHIACTSVLLASLLVPGTCSPFRELLAKSQHEVSSEEERASEEIKLVEEPSTPAPQPLQGNIHVNVTSDPGDDIPEVIVNVAPSVVTQIKPIIHPEQRRHKKSPYCVQVQKSPYDPPQTICDHHASAMPQEQHFVAQELPGLMVHQNADPMHHLAQAALASAALGTAAHTFYNQQEQPAAIVTHHPPSSMQPTNPGFSYHSSGTIQQFNPTANAPFILPQGHIAPFQIQQLPSFPIFQPSAPTFNNRGSYHSSDCVSTPVIQTMGPSFQSHLSSFGSAYQSPYGNQPSPHTFSAPPQQVTSSYNAPSYSHPAASYNTQTYGQTGSSHFNSLPPQHIPTSYNPPSHGNPPSSHTYATSPQQAFQFNVQPQESHGSYQSQQSYGTTSYPRPFYGNPNDMSEPQSVKLMPSFTSAGVTENYRESESEKKDLNQTDDTNSTTPVAQALRESNDNAPTMYQHPAQNVPFTHNSQSYLQSSSAAANYGPNNPSLNLPSSFTPSHSPSFSFAPQNAYNSVPSFNPISPFNTAPGFNFVAPEPFFNPIPQFPSALPLILNNPNFPVIENGPINNIPFSFNPNPFTLFAPTAPISSPIISGPIFSQGALQPYNTGTMLNNNGGALCTAYGPRGTPVPLRIMCHVQPLNAPQTAINLQTPTYRDDLAPEVQVNTDKDKSVKGKDDDNSSSSEELLEEVKSKAALTTSNPGDASSANQQSINNQTSDQPGDASKARQSSQPQLSTSSGLGLQQGEFGSQLGRPLNQMGQDRRGGQQLGQSGQFSSQGGQNPGQPGQFNNQGRPMSQGSQSLGQLFGQQGTIRQPIGQSGLLRGQSGQQSGQSGARAAYGGWGNVPYVGGWNIAPTRNIRYPAPPFPQFGPEYY